MGDIIEFTRQTREEFTVQYMDGNTPVSIAGYEAQVDLVDANTKQLAVRLSTAAPTENGSTLTIDETGFILTGVFSTAEMNLVKSGTYVMQTALILNAEVTRPQTNDVLVSDNVAQVAS